MKVPTTKLTIAMRRRTRRKPWALDSQAIPAIDIPTGGRGISYMVVDLGLTRTVV